MKLILLILGFSGLAAHAQLPYDLVDFQAHSNGGTSQARKNFTVYFVRDMTVNGKRISVAGIQSNNRSIIEVPDENTSKVLVEADLALLRKLIESTFSPGKEYKLKSLEAICGSVPSPILNFYVKGSPENGNGAINCPEKGISTSAAAVLTMIEQAVSNISYMSLKNYRSLGQ